MFVGLQLLWPRFAVRIPNPWSRRRNQCLGGVVVVAVVMIELGERRRGFVTTNSSLENHLSKAHLDLFFNGNSHRRHGKGNTYPKGRC